MKRMCLFFQNKTYPNDFGRQQWCTHYSTCGVHDDECTFRVSRQFPTTRRQATPFRRRPETCPDAGTLATRQHTTTSTVAS